MNKSIKNYITLLVTVLVVFGALIGTDLLVRPTINNNIMKEKIASYSESLSGIEKIEAIEITSSDGQGITDKQIAYNNDDDIIGYLYTASKTNSWGSITIRMAIDATGKIIGASADVNQSLRAEETKAYIVAHVGMNVDQPDSIAGPTTLDSVKTADEIIEAIAKSHSLLASDIELSELEELYGKGATLELDNDFTATPEVLSRSLVVLEEAVIGLVYRVKGTGIYAGDNEGSIEIDFALDNEGIYLGQIVDLEKYEHTPGFRNNALKAFEAIINENINDIVIEDLDTISGATNTSKLMIEMLEDLKAVFMPYEALTEVELIFGKGATLELDNDFTATPEVLSRSKALIDNDVVGFIYEVKGTGIYFGDNEGSITINFALDNDGIYLGKIVDLDKYEHTAGFRDRALTVLKDLKGTNINDLVINDLDTNTGATNTSTVITVMLENLKEAFQ